MIDELNKLWMHRRLRRNVWMSRSELEDIQRKKLMALINHAYRNVPYYHRLFNSVGIKPDDIKNVDDLHKIPITTKEQIQQAGNEFIANGIDLNKCKWHSTSGSTGMPLKVLFNKKDYTIKNLTYLRTYTENGLRLFRDRILNITGPHNIPKNNNWLNKFGFIKNEYISVYDEIDNQLLKLSTFNPNVIIGYAMSIKHLALAVQNNNKIQKFDKTIVFTSSELLDDSSRKTIKSVFGEVIDGYGSVELGRMAWECHHHSGYHIGIDTSVMEFIKNDEQVASGESGEIIATNLNSYAMPIIRYKTGDIGIPKNKSEKCPCGRGLPLMEIIEGRSGDFIIMSDGRVFSPLSFFALMKPFFSELQNYRIIQEKKDLLVLKIVVVKDVLNSNDLISRIEVNLKKILGDYIKIKIDIVDEIKKEKSGKFRSVISNVKNSE